MRYLVAILLSSAAGCLHSAPVAAIRVEAVPMPPSMENVVSVVRVVTPAGVVMHLATDADGHPMWVGFNLAADDGYWTATTNLVYATGGVCSDGQ